MTLGCEKARLGKTRGVQFPLRSGPAPTSLCDLGKFPDLSEPQLSHQFSGDNDTTCFLRLFWALHEVTLTSFP